MNLNMTVGQAACRL